MRMNERAPMAGGISRRRGVTLPGGSGAAVARPACLQAGSTLRDGPARDPR
jgi:hypothetical protein